MEAKQMHFGCLVKKGCAEVRTREIPPLGENQVLLKQLACNICTTDYGQWLGLRESRGYPMAGGHEVSALVAAVGSNVKEFRVGDYVAVAYEGCGMCEACRSGDPSECVHKSAETTDGYKKGFFGFADYAVKNAACLVRIAPDIPPSEAAFLEPLATVLRGLKKLSLAPRESVAVIGAGTMGLVNAAAAKTFGCRVIVLDVAKKKLETAQAMGFETVDSSAADPVAAVKALTGGEGTDCVIVAVGNDAVNQQALDMVRQVDGRILFFAANYPAPKLNVDSNLIHYRRLALIGTYDAFAQDFYEAGEMINKKQVDFSRLVEPRHYRLDEIQEAFSAAATPGMYRVSVILNTF